MLEKQLPIRKIPVPLLLFQILMLLLFLSFPTVPSQRPAKHTAIVRRPLRILRILTIPKAAFPISRVTCDL